MEQKDDELSDLAHTPNDRISVKTKTQALQQIMVEIFRDVNEARTLEAEAEARTLEAEAEARTLEAKVEAKAEFIQFWPSEL